MKKRIASAFVSKMAQPLTDGYYEDVVFRNDGSIVVLTRINDIYSMDQVSITPIYSAEANATYYVVQPHDCSWKGLAVEYY